MAERCVKGDYIGFTFGGVHSSELGLMRVSNGSRYEQDLLPPLQDKTAQVNGRDGAVYFGSQYNTKPIKVPVAFDNMTEESFNQLKRLLQDKKPKYLWFDETPYKQWLVKAANVQNFKWVCFDESKNIERENDGDPVSTKKRIYKGEGTLEFSCFSPYAESRVTFLDDLIDDVWFWNQEETPRKLIREHRGFRFKTIFTKDNNSIQELLQVKHNTNDIPQQVYYNNKTYSALNYANEKFRELCYLDNNTSRVDLFIVLPVRFQQSLNNAAYYAWYPGDVLGSKRTLRAFFVKDSNLFPLTINNSNFFDAYNLSYNEQSQKIAITNILTASNNKIPEYYYKIDQTPTDDEQQELVCILLYKDEKENIYWIDPTTGEPNYDIPVFCGYARKTEELNTLERYYNFEEWVDSSKLKTRQDYIEFNKYENQQVGVYNAGDIPTNIQLIYTNNPDEEMSLTLRSIYDEEKVVGQITLKKFSFIGEDNGFVIDSKLKLIKGTKDGEFTGTVYNKYIKSGDFFKIPVCDYDEYYTITSSINQEFSVEYKHYYI